MRNKITLPLFLIIVIVILINTNKGIAMAGKSDYDYYKEKLKGVSISDGVNKEEAIILAQNYIIDDRKLKIMYIVQKPKIYETRLSEGYWEVQFPLRWKYGIGPLRRWGVLYVDIKTGEVEGGGQAPDL